MSPSTPPSGPGPQWPVPTALILLSLIPVIAGAARLTELTGGAPITAQNARFFASPVPVVIHIVSVTVYSLLGAFQFVSALRGRRGWHRTAGSVLIPAGLLAALSGLWMSAFYPLPDGTTDVPIRLFFGSAMLASIILGIVAVRRRDFVGHGAWMTRGYAIGVGAGTQALVISGLAVPRGHARRTDAGPADGGGLADQPRGGRVRHSSTRPSLRPDAQSRRPRCPDCCRDRAVNSSSECLNSTCECPPAGLDP